ncbi:MAG: HU family DNA-binding protein [Dysgonomonas sp.]|nr:HU family DNA-binding protein [Dysgonomonas sp.]
MNDRLSLQDLVDLLAQKQEITKKDAESFLRELVAVISENIESNEPVKVKDFGTFKLVKVNARKSVDVNTGEAIEIPAHYKLSFTPDKSLKDAVNRPFAHFESVILEDGVTFDNVEKVEGVEETENEVVDEAEIIPPTIVPLVNNPQEVDDTNKEPDEIVEERIIEEEKIDEPEEVFVTPDNDTEPSIDVEAEPMVEAEAETMGESAEAKDDDEEFEQAYYDYLKKSKRRKRMIALGFFIFVILAGFFVGALYFQEIASYLTDGPKKPENVAVADTIEATISADPDSISMVLDGAEKVDSIKADGTVVEQPQVATPVAPAVDVNKPLGTETIKSGQTLRLISLKYYGHKSFWVHIYEENKAAIKNPNNVPIGTKLVIPSPAKYGIDAKNPAVVEKAKNAESKLIRQLGL